MMFPVQIWKVMSEKKAISTERRTETSLLATERNCINLWIIIHLIREHTHNALRNCLICLQRIKSFGQYKLYENMAKFLYEMRKNLRLFLVKFVWNS